ncbi:MAG: PrsW family intramembrane metalloprotease [Bacteroidia bacterium]|nr:PrsW family intramembrane metalloprotease [Bacteroidia bacterium]
MANLAEITTWIHVGVAVFIAWIWVDYYRLINIYSHSKLGYLILTFSLGCASVGIVTLLHRFTPFPAWLPEDGTVIGDLLYCVIRVGLVEEICKLIPFLIMFALFRKQIREPIDFVAFISVSALGFSAVENVFYMQRYGPWVIDSRSILCSVGHMFDTSIIAYGVVRYKFLHRKNSIPLGFWYLLLAAISHGFYDFWLTHKGAENWGWIVTNIYFMFTISFYAIILNNALNNSSGFTYKKIIDGDALARRLLIYYGILFLVQLILISQKRTFEQAAWHMAYTFITSGFIIIISVVRLSRFKLIKGRWENLRVELPFTFSPMPGEPNASAGFRVRGESVNEVNVNRYYEEYCLITPVSPVNSRMKKPCVAFIEKKMFLNHEVPHYLARVYKGDSMTNPEFYLLRPKRRGLTLMNDQYPIVAMMKITTLPDAKQKGKFTKKLQFVEWASLAPKPELQAERARTE